MINYKIISSVHFFFPQTLYVYKIISSYCRTKNYPTTCLLKALYYNFHLYKLVLDLDKPKKTQKIWVVQKSIEDFLLDVLKAFVK